MSVFCSHFRSRTINVFVWFGLRERQKSLGGSGCVWSCSVYLFAALSRLVSYRSDSISMVVLNKWPTRSSIGFSGALEGSTVLRVASVLTHKTRIRGRLTLHFTIIRQSTNGYSSSRNILVRIITTLTLPGKKNRALFVTICLQVPYQFLDQVPCLRHFLLQDRGREMPSDGETGTSTGTKLQHSEYLATCSRARRHARACVALIYLATPQASTGTGQPRMLKFCERSLRPSCGVLSS